jgi:hypothetical protein
LEPRREGVMASSRRLVALIVAGLAIAGIAVAGVGAGGTADGTEGPSYPASGVSVTSDGEGAASSGGRMLVRAVDDLAPRMDGRLYEISDDAAASPAGRLACKQVHASAAGPGLCMALSDDGFRYEGIVFDGDYGVLRRFPIDGVPDRARVSGDGRYGAYTAFDRGSAGGYFANANAFSTDTRIVDMRTGRVLLRLGSGLEVLREGRRYNPASPQFWGVTFADGDRFYATMATDFVHLLIEGDVSSKKAHVIGRNVECPSLSPDGQRIAYKRRIKYTDRWRFHVRDLQTGRDVALAETRSIDDQPEWLDDDRIVYSDDRAVFTVPADGTGRPERLVEGAASPAVVAASPAG